MHQEMVCLPAAVGVLGKWQDPSLSRHIHALPHRACPRKLKRQGLPSPMQKLLYMTGPVSKGHMCLQNAPTDANVRSAAIAAVSAMHGLLRLWLSA